MTRVADMCLVYDTCSSPFGFLSNVYLFNVHPKCIYFYLKYCCCSMCTLELYLVYNITTACPLRQRVQGINDNLVCKKMY